jgi:hypothetical protein
MGDADTRTLSIAAYLVPTKGNYKIQDRWIMEFTCIGFLTNQDRGVRHVQRGKQRRGGALWRLGGSLSTDHMLPNYGPNHRIDRIYLSTERHQDYDDYD